MTARGRTVTVRQFEEILESAICFYDALYLMTEMVAICNRVHECIAEQLCKKLFAPLYSTIFAVNARIFACLCRLMLECDMQFEKTRQFVKVPILTIYQICITKITINCIYNRIIFIYIIVFYDYFNVACSCPTCNADRLRQQILEDGDLPCTGDAGVVVHQDHHGSHD